MQLGIQLWAVCGGCPANRDTFLRLAKQGYTFVEPCILFGAEAEAFPALWTPKKYNALRGALASVGLKARSCHAFTAKAELDAGAMLAFAESTGIRSFVVKCPGEISLPAFEKAAAAYEQLVRTLAGCGCELWLHPEGKDCAESLEGIPAFEWMLRRVPGLKIQADVGWMTYGGISQKRFLREYAGRIASVHYKDVNGTAAQGLSPEAAACPIGEGVVPLFDAFAFARRMEIPQIVDSDQTALPALEEAERAARRFLAMSGERAPEQSVLELLDTETGERRALHVFDRIIEAPNWLQKRPDTLLYNSNGRLYRYSISEDREELVESGECDSLNNDHVPAPDERLIGVSHMTVKDGRFTSKVFTVDLEGKEPPKQVLPGDINFLHGWSPDGTELACCAFRPANPADRTETGRKADGSSAALDVDVWTTKLSTGQEKRLTFGAGYSDGPEYDPDNETIWFNSTMGGRMQVYTIKRDGSQLTHIPTTADRNDWFPHVSPDGKKVVFLSFGGAEILPSEHIPGMNVRLYLMERDGSHLKELACFYGGQGSVNVNSWAPDSRWIAFVSYREKDE